MAGLLEQKFFKLQGKLLTVGFHKGDKSETFCGLNLSEQGLRESLHHLANELMIDLVLKRG